ncbi:MAG: hypothetical protein ACFHXK_08290 [bacterium]
MVGPDARNHRWQWPIWLPLCLSVWSGLAFGLSSGKAQQGHWDGGLITSISHYHSLNQSESVRSKLEFGPYVEWSQSENKTWVFSGRITADAQDLFLPGEPEFHSYSSGSRPYATDKYWVFELRDAYLELDSGGSQIKLGKQQIVWGALDGIKVLDVLNPQSFEEFILDDFSSSRIGLWSLYVDTTIAGWRTELALIPDTSVHFIPPSDARFALTAPRFQFGHEAPGNQTNTLTIGPDDKEGTVGIRFSRYLGGVDLQLVAVSGLDFEPYAQIVADTSLFMPPGSGPLLSLSHARREVYGFAAQTSIAQSVLRLEASYIADRTFNLRTPVSLTHRKLNQWRAALGFDINAPLGLFVNIQYLYDQVIDAPAGLTRPETEQILTTFLRKTFAYDTFKYELRYYTSLEDKDAMLSNRLEYQLNDNMLLRLAYDNFRGTAKGNFGQFSEQDQVSLTWQWTL